MVYLFFRCFPKRELQPPEHPMVCQHSESFESKSLFVIKCCNNYDYCNRDLSPTLAPPRSVIGNFYSLPVLFILKLTLNT